jgi:hypothetical protein
VVPHAGCPPPARAREETPTELVHEFTLRARLEPAVAFGAGLLGERVFFHAVEGSVAGGRLRGTLLPGGGDWLVAHPSGWGVLDVWAQLRTHDGASIYIHYPGLVEMNAAFMAAFGGGKATRFEDQYFRTTPRRATGLPPRGRPHEPARARPRARGAGVRRRPLARPRPPAAGDGRPPAPAPWYLPCQRAPSAARHGRELSRVTRSRSTARGRYRWSGPRQPWPHGAAMGWEFMLSARA